TGAGTTLILSGTNTYSGITTIGDGTHASTLQGGATDAFSVNSAVLLSKAGTLDLGGFNQNIFSLADGTGGGGTVTNSGASGTNILTLSGGATTAFSGTIEDGAHATTGLTL